ncbi:hypothetical protein B0H19DRAFT_29582 [Mycena capillaripes]|nr:hypothetical protein B0H19DRAFT_29582 [Mycena capillaripes]
MQSNITSASGLTIDRPTSAPGPVGGPSTYPLDIEPTGVKSGISTPTRSKSKAMQLGAHKVPASVAAAALVEQLAEEAAAAEGEGNPWGNDDLIDVNADDDDWSWVFILLFSSCTKQWIGAFETAQPTVVAPSDGFDGALSCRNFEDLPVIALMYMHSQMMTRGVRVKSQKMVHGATTVVHFPRHSRQKLSSRRQVVLRPSHRHLSQRLLVGTPSEHGKSLPRRNRHLLHPPIPHSPCRKRRKQLRWPAARRNESRSASHFFIRNIRVLIIPFSASPR